MSPAARTTSNAPSRRRGADAPSGTIHQAAFATWVGQQADSGRYELVRGHIVHEPPARWEHGESGARLALVVGSFVHRRRLGRIFDASVGIELPSGDTVQPDLAFVSARRWRATPQEPGTFLRLVPDLAVEILSPSSAKCDLLVKRAIYEQNGVREYWVVDVEARTIARFALANGRFDAGKTFAAGEALRSVVLRGLRVPIGDLLPVR